MLARFMSDIHPALVLYESEKTDENAVIEAIEEGRELTDLELMGLAGHCVFQGHSRAFFGKLLKNEPQGRRGMLLAAALCFYHQKWLEGDFFTQMEISHPNWVDDLLFYHEDGLCGWDRLLVLTRTVASKQHAERKAIVLSKVAQHIEARYPTVFDEIHPKLPGITKGQTWAFLWACIPMVKESIDHWAFLLTGNVDPNFVIETEQGKMSLGTALLWAVEANSEIPQPKGWNVVPAMKIFSWKEFPTNTMDPFHVQLEALELLATVGMDGSQLVEPTEYVFPGLGMLMRAGRPGCVGLKFIGTHLDKLLRLGVDFAGNQEGATLLDAIYSGRINLFKNGFGEPFPYWKLPARILECASSPDTVKGFIFSNHFENLSLFEGTKFSTITIKGLRSLRKVAQGDDARKLDILIDKVQSNQPCGVNSRLGLKLLAYIEALSEKDALVFLLKKLAEYITYNHHKKWCYPPHEITFISKKFERTHELDGAVFDAVLNLMREIYELDSQADNTRANDYLIEKATRNDSVYGYMIRTFVDKIRQLYYTLDKEYNEVLIDKNATSDERVMAYMKAETVVKIKSTFGVHQIQFETPDDIDQEIVSCCRKIDIRSLLLTLMRLPQTSIAINETSQRLNHSLDDLSVMIKTRKRIDTTIINDIEKFITSQYKAGEALAYIEKIKKEDGPGDDRPVVELFTRQALYDAQELMRKAQDNASVEYWWGQLINPDKKQGYIETPDRIRQRFRRMALAQHALDSIGEMRDNFPHFEEVIRDLENHLLLAVRGDGRFSLPPLLIDGPPGTGKTFFFQELSKKISTAYHMVSMETVTAGWAITGLDHNWSGATPGFVFETLMKKEATANPIILLDEIDKVAGSEQSPVANVLLSLLEPHSARRFTDRCVPLMIDASNINWVATANYLDRIDPAIRSRLTIMHVPNPDYEARRAMAHHIYRSLLKTNSWGPSFAPTLSESTLEALAKPANAARSLRKNIQTALANAARANHDQIHPEDLPVDKKVMACVPWDAPLPELESAHKEGQA